MTEPAWLADPTGRHQTRYWNGREWTGHVADNGVAGFDPPSMPPPTEMAQAPFAPPAPPDPSPQQPSGSGKWWIVAAAILAVASIPAVIAIRDSKHSTSSGSAGASSGGGGTSVRLEFTDANGYQYVVEHTGAVQLQRSIDTASPGFAVVHVIGGKVSVANANTGRNAPMPTVRLLAYLKVPDCDSQTSLFGDVETKVSLRASCMLEIHSDWSHEADIANGMGGLDSSFESVLKPGQTAVAAVDDSWFEPDPRSTVPDTVDVSGPVAWGIEVAQDDLTGTPSCVIRLVSNDAPLLQELAGPVAEITRSDVSRLNMFNCEVTPG